MGNLKGESLGEWKRLHQFIFRATSESPKERFQGAEAFYKAIESDSRKKSVKPSSRLILTSLIGLTLLVLAVGYWMIERHKSAPPVEKNIPAVPAMLSTTPPSTSRPEWMDHPQHIYSKAEVKLLNRFIAENNQAAIEKLKSDNEARYRELIKKLPPGAGFSWVEEKMRFPENP
jgi:hypothetical protein